MQATEPQRPLGQLFSELAHETGTLIKKEVELAKTELAAKAAIATRNAAFVAAGGAIVLAGALTLLAALVLAVGTLMPLWASALLIGALISGIGASLVLAGVRAFKRFDPAPRETVQTLKENRQWAREQLSR